jgi:lipopolysaccharide/colanic/teichoic acid biosynthesis glycosyltransferase
MADTDVYECIVAQAVKGQDAVTVVNGLMKSKSLDELEDIINVMRLTIDHKKSISTILEGMK